MLAKSPVMTSRRQRDDYAYRAVAEQARRRAARWHAWLKSPECTFQDRENFERWCSDAANAAAYVGLCSELANEAGDDFGFAAHALTPPVRWRLETEPR